MSALVAGRYSTLAGAVDIDYLSLGLTKFECGAFDADDALALARLFLIASEVGRPFAVCVGDVEWDEAGGNFASFALIFETDIRCRVCGCTEQDCGGCIERSGIACSWVDDPEGGDLCSSCRDGYGPKLEEVPL